MSITTCSSRSTGFASEPRGDGETPPEPACAGGLAPTYCGARILPSLLDTLPGLILVDRCIECGEVGVDVVHVVHVVHIGDVEGAVDSALRSWTRLTAPCWRSSRSLSLSRVTVTTLLAITDTPGRALYGAAQ